MAGLHPVETPTAACRWPREIHDRILQGMSVLKYPTCSLCENMPMSQKDKSETTGKTDLNDFEGCKSRAT